MLGVGEQFANLIVGFQIGCRIGARTFSYRVLVDEFHRFDTLQVAAQFAESPRKISPFAEMAPKGTIEYVAHERRLSRAAYSGDSCHDSQRKFHVDVLEVVFACADNFNIVGEVTAPHRNRNRQPAGKITDGIALRGVSSVNIGRRAVPNDFPPELSGFRADVDQPVGLAHDLFVVLYDNNRVAGVAEPFENIDKAPGVARV